MSLGGNSGSDGRLLARVRLGVVERQLQLNEQRFFVLEENFTLERLEAPGQRHVMKVQLTLELHAQEEKGDAMNVPSFGDPPTDPQSTRAASFTFFYWTYGS